MQTKDIDSVLYRLEYILDECIRTRNKTGYFVALYVSMTNGLRQAINDGQFDDKERMEQLVVAFGDKFFNQWEKWQKKEPLTQSWEIVMNAGVSKGTLLLHQLLLGINAHINLDLGIAIVETMKGKPIKDIHADFNRVNAIFTKVTLKAIHDIIRSSQFLAIIGFQATKSNTTLINFLIENARDSAWLFAENLSAKSDVDYVNYINERDERVRSIADSILNMSKPMKATLMLVRLFEYKRPSKVMNSIRSGVIKKPLVRAAFSYS